MATTMDTELTRRLKEHSEVIKFAQEVLGIMTSSDLQQETRKNADTVDKIKNKVSKAKESTYWSIQALETRKASLKTKIDEECGNTIPGDMNSGGFSEASISIASSNVQEINSEINGKTKDCKKLENERKILEFHKRHRKLQRKVVNIQFDLTSTENCIKGYLKRSDGMLQTFEFNLIDDSPLYVTNFLWDCM